MFDQNTKILIIDDMMTMRKLVAKAFSSLGFKTFVEAPDGEKAWNLLKADKDIGLVISDWNMPNCTGLELLRRVRTDDDLKDIPFILLTAESEAAQVKQAVVAGVDNYIVKPFTAETLKDKLLQTYKTIVQKAS